MSKAVDLESGALKARFKERTPLEEVCTLKHLCALLSTCESDKVYKAAAYGALRVNYRYQAFMLRQLDDELWVAEQPFKYLGLDVGTRMTIVRFSSGNLAVISPIEITEENKRKIDSVGDVTHIIAPNLYHHLYAGVCKSWYPHATLWGASGLQEKRPDLAVDCVIKPDGSKLWQALKGLFFDGFKTLGPNGFDTLNEWVFLHSASRTLVLTDAAFYYDSSFPWTVQLAARVLGSYDMLKPSILEKIAIGDRQALKNSVEAVLQWDFDRVVMAHGRVIEEGGKEMFRKGYCQFLADSWL